MRNKLLMESLIFFILTIALVFLSRFLPLLYQGSTSLLYKLGTICFMAAFYEEAQEGLSKFWASRYKFYKAVGDSSRHIFLHYVYEQRFFLLLFFEVFFFLSCIVRIDGKALLFWGSFELCILLILFATAHFKIGKLLGLLVKGAELSFILYALFFFSEQYKKGYTIYQTLAQFGKTSFLRLPYQFLFTHGQTAIIVLLVFSVVLFAGMRLLDDRMVEERMGRKRKERSNKQLDLMLLLRKKESVFGFFVIYVSYFFLLYLFGEWSSACVFTAFLYLSLSCLCIEVFYHETASMKMWYLLLGGTYEDFLMEKIKVSAVLTLFVPMAASIKLLFIGGFLPTALVIWMVWGFALLYQNLYYASYYLNMKNRMNAIEALAAVFFALLLYLPVANVVLCIQTWKSGKRKWSLYVNHT
ncbi:MAG: hypothetical protein ACI4DR_00725 [Roseburia sp.]